jgi:MFS family permease
MKASTVQMLSSAALSASALLIPNLAQDDFGASTAEVGVVVASYSAALFVSSYVFGRYSDVHGRRTILKVGLLLTSIAAFLQIFAHDTLTLELSRLLLGLCAGMYPSALLAYVYESDKKVGKFSSYGSLGFGIGTFLAGLIGVYYQIFLFSAIVMFVAFLVALNLPEMKETRHKVPFFPASVFKRNFPIYVSIMFRHTGANMIWVIYTLFLASLGASPLIIGAIYAINAVCQFVFMQFCDRYHSAPLIVVGFIMSILTFPSYTLATIYWQIIPAQIMIALAWSTLYVGSVKYVMERNKEKGTSAGILQSVLSISAILGALLGGVAEEIYGYHGCMYLATGIAIVGFVIFIISDRWATKRMGKDFSAAAQ